MMFLFLSILKVDFETFPDLRALSHFSWLPLPSSFSQNGGG
jgi:hypothetical protein